MKTADEIEKYLSWSFEQTRTLFERNYSVKINHNSIPVLDLPSFKTEKEYNQLIKTVARSGYYNFNIGLTPIWLKKNCLTIKTIKKMPIISAHGTSIKNEISTNIPYRESLMKDLKTLDLIDPAKKLLINYDLFAGHVVELNFSDNFAKTKSKSAILLNNNLGILSAEITPELLVVNRIIQDVAAIFKKSKRKICFEIPGTKGWSMFPELSIFNIDYIFKQIKKYIPSATICIDLGHAITWGDNSKDFKMIKKIVNKYKDSISMLHISSAGSYYPAFINAYKLQYGNKYPDWHIKSLDLALPVFELPMFNLLNLLRNEISGKLIEVSENRLPSAAIKDYFPDYIKVNFDKKRYYKGLFEQGKILGYID
jgi:hypothetical protein